MPLVQDDLRGQVVGRATQGVRPPAPGQGFGEPKVGDLEVAARVHQQVFWFQVAVHDAPRVQGGQGGHHLRRVKLGGRLGQAAPGTQVAEEFAAGDVLQGKVNALRVLKKVDREKRGEVEKKVFFSLASRGERKRNKARTLFSPFLSLTWNTPSRRT